MHFYMVRVGQPLTNMTVPLRQDPDDSGQGNMGDQSIAYQPDQQDYGEAPPTDEPGIPYYLLSKYAQDQNQFRGWLRELDNMKPAAKARWIEMLIDTNKPRLVGHRQCPQKLSLCRLSKHFYQHGNVTSIEAYCMPDGCQK